MCRSLGFRIYVRKLGIWDLGYMRRGLGMSCLMTTGNCSCTTALVSQKEPQSFTGSLRLLFRHLYFVLVGSDYRNVTPVLMRHTLYPPIFCVEQCSGHYRKLDIGFCVIGLQHCLVHVSSSNIR